MKSKLEKILKQRATIITATGLIVFGLFVISGNYYIGLFLAIFISYCTSLILKFLKRNNLAKAVVVIAFCFVVLFVFLVIVNWNYIIRSYEYSSKMAYTAGYWRLEFDVPENVKAGEYFIEIQIRCNGGLMSEFCSYGNEGIKFGFTGPFHNYYKHLKFNAWAENYISEQLGSILPIIRRRDAPDEFNITEGRYVITVASNRSESDVYLDNKNHEITIKIFKNRF